MREEMDQILREEYAQKLQFSCDSIELELEEKYIEGSFKVKSPSGKAIKGQIFVLDPRMICKEKKLQGEEMEISYCFDGSYVEPGETVSGSFSIVSNCGEYEIPFSVRRPKKILNSSLGEIRNLFHFTNLARTNWEEAVKLFFAPGFAHILSNTDSRYLELYRGLSANHNEQHMEEFLLAVNKKKQVTYAVETEELLLENISESYKEELSILRKGWGYTYVRIKTEGEFLSIEKNLLRDEDFMGNTCRLPVYIHAEKLHQGKNWGQIVLTTPYDTIRFPVLVCQNQHHRMRTAIEKRRNNKWLNSKLTEAYISFRSKTMAAERFKKESEEVLEALRKSDERNPLIKLYGAHLYITQDKFHEAKWQLDRAAKYIQLQNDPAIYAYYLYLTTLLSEDEDYVQQVKDKVEELYYCHENSWQIAWLWMYLSKELRGHAQRKWNFLKQVFLRGCTSPVMYTEAILLLNYQPTLLMELGEAEIRILRFGQKRGMLSPSVKGVLQYFAFREKEFSAPLCDLLAAICNEEENAELLGALCSLLIKGNKVEHRYFKWYEKAVLAGVKITRLYEYYMMSLDREKYTDIPRMVLMYFSYQSELNYEYASYLYRYVFENREQMQDLYLAYAPGIERFVLKQLYAGKINEDLGYLYENVIVPGMMTEDNAKALVKVLFTHALKWKKEYGEKLIVVHRQKKEERVYERMKNILEARIYAKGCQLFREDKWGNRFVWDKEYPLPYMDIKATVERISSWIDHDGGLALFYCDGNQDWQAVTAENEKYFIYLSEADEIKEEEKQEINIRLLDYYYDIDAMERLDWRLENYLSDSIAYKDRNKLIHYLVVRQFYEKAYELIKVYAPENMKPKDLVRITTYMLEEDEKEDEVLQWYIYTAFKKGKYNAAMLQYLVNTYKGSSKDMEAVFCAARDFEIEAYAICERLLIQILHTKTYIENEVDIFKTYIAGGAKTPVEAAFLTYSAVEYMRDSRMIDSYLIMDIGRVHKRGFQLPLVTHLAYLRYYAENPGKRVNAQKDILQEFLQEIVFEKEMLVPFLQEYADMPGMEGLADKTLISYKTEAKRRVVIHYLRIGKDDSREIFQKEEMKEIYFGVYVKEFILFYGEQLQYYITEEQDNQEQLTESGIIQKEERDTNTKNSRYQMINELAIGQTMQDYVTLDSLLEEYWRLEFIADKVFHI